MEKPYEAVGPLRTPGQGSLYRTIQVRVYTGKEIVPGKGSQASWQEWQLPYAVVLSQACDLASHFLPSDDNDKQLFSVLVCPAYPDFSFRAGNHLSELKWSMLRQNSERWGVIQKNNDPRYHYLSSCPDLQVQSTVVDFKHYFSLSVQTLSGEYSDNTHYIARLTCPYREHISQRFAAYLSRVGLPFQHHQLDKMGAEKGS